MIDQQVREAARKLAEPYLAQGYTPEALHDYRDADGHLQFCRFRLKHPTKGKVIRPMHPEGGEWKLGEPKLPKKTLYRLEQIAKRPDEPILIVEGEKAVERAISLGLLATTSGGSTSAGQADWTPVKGRDVVIWPDHDAPGAQFGKDVAALLAPLARSIATIDASNLHLMESGDIVDWLDQHPAATKEDILALAEIVSEKIEGWPAPVPLPNQLPPVAPFDADLLPDAIQAWIMDVAERLQCPPDFPAVGAMVALSSVIGRRIGVRPKQRDDWTEAANLWGCIVGSPGVLKSPALQEVLRPLRKLDTKCLESFEAERKAWRISELQKKSELKRTKGGDFAQYLEEPEPQPKRYIVNDSTVEALGEILRKEGNHPLVYRDELIGLLKSLDKEGNEGARAFYLTAWGGKEPYSFDRITRGMNLRIDALCFSMLGSIQPSVIGNYLRQAIAGGGDDGLTARFQLLVWPDISGEWRRIDRKPDQDAAAAALARFEWLDAMTPERVGATVEEGRIPYLRFTPEAQEFFWGWLEDLDKRIRSGDEHPAFEAHLSKYRKLVPALALVIHLVDAGQGSITEKAVARALAWSEYLESHARRAYASVLQAEADGARALLRRIRKGEVSNPFAERDVYRNHWAHLACLEQTTEACRMLEAHGFIKSERLLTGGRPTLQYILHPDLCATATS